MACHGETYPEAFRVRYGEYARIVGWTEYERGVEHIDNGGAGIFAPLER